MTKTILVVEDDENLLKLYIEEFRDEGYRVLRAGNGCEALELAKDYYPDVVVLDINLPDRDGMEVLAQLVEGHPQLPVIINTAHPCYEDNYLTWLADAFVCKSSDLSELKSRVKQSLVKKKCDQDAHGTAISERRITGAKSKDPRV